MKYIIFEDTYHYKKGQIVKADKIVDNGIIHNNNFISKDVLINEALEKDDLVKIKAMIKSQLELLFWRLYTKSSFLTN